MPTKFNYEKKVWGGPVVKPLPWYIQGLKLQYTLDDLQDVRGKVVDIGCGAGNMIMAVKQARPDLLCFGMDISKTAIQIAKKHPGVAFQVGVAEKVPYKSNTYDAVLMYDVLEHLYHPEKALREAKRIMKKNAVLHIFSPIDAQPWTFYWVIHKLGWQPKNKHTGHVQVFTDKSFEELLKKEGFTVEKRRFSFHYLISVFDILYFSLLEFLHYDPPASIEGMVYKKRYLFSFIFNLFYRCIIVLSYCESRLFWWFPAAGGVSLLIRKKRT